MTVLRDDFELAPSTPLAPNPLEPNPLEINALDNDDAIVPMTAEEAALSAEAAIVESRITDDLNKLLEMLPTDLRDKLHAHPDKDKLIEVVMDLGRLPEARFPGKAEYLSDRPITQADLEDCVKTIGDFGGDNRAGIERTLHRISAIRNRRGDIIGLTCRVGRAVFGTISMIRDLVESGKSILMLGRPGVGKTTALREIARVLADDLGKRVVIIDTSNEIAGDGDVPHPAIGRARRMQVAKPELQHQVMIEAVENHMPEVIVIDEIGTELEAIAARTIAERGVQLRIRWQSYRLRARSRPACAEYDPCRWKRARPRRSRAEGLGLHAWGCGRADLREWQGPRGRPTRSGSCEQARARWGEGRTRALLFATYGLSTRTRRARCVPGRGPR